MFYKPGTPSNNRNFENQLNSSSGSLDPHPSLLQPASHRPGGGVRGAFRKAVGFVLILWVVFLVSFLGFGGEALHYGIRPRDTPSLTGVLTAPLLHANFEHLLGNTFPGAVFAFLVGYSGRRAFWEVSFIVVLIAGIGTWMFGGVGTVHIGASGLVYGWLIYLVVRGFFNRSFRQISIGVILGFMYSGLLLGLLPGVPGVSWQSHMFGAIGGVIAGMIITSDDPFPRRKHSVTG